jgi:hypothetical protein
MILEKELFKVQNLIKKITKINQRESTQGNMIDM